MHRFMSTLHRWACPAGATLDLSGKITEAYFDRAFDQAVTVTFHYGDSAFFADLQAIGEDFNYAMSAKDKELEAAGNARSE